MTSLALVHAPTSIYKCKIQLSFNLKIPVGSHLTVRTDSMQHAQICFSKLTFNVYFVTNRQGSFSLCNLKDKIKLMSTNNKVPIATNLQITSS